MIITTQPENYFGSVGGTATFTVEAEGDRVTYQWQRSINDGDTWDNISGGTSTTLSVPIQAGVNGYLYRCIAKDFMGHIATSQAGRLSVTNASPLSTHSEFEPEFTIINEPDDYYGRPGDIATFIVEAEGENLSYNWLYRAPGANNFEYLTSSDATTNTLRVEMTAASNGAEYRCFITDANGDVGSTRIATVKLDILDWEMEYNASGIRTKRVSDEKTYNYIYDGDKLMRMTVGDDTLDFSYDANGVPLTVTYNGTVYYYITNLQGDVVSLERADGGGSVQYVYDAWGKIIRMSSSALAELNPLRYRGYVYDQETGFYYLNSRYYDPAVGRFINADSTDYLGADSSLASVNLFNYCANNPVNRFDTQGNLSLPNWAKVAIGVGVIGVAAAVTVATGGAAAGTLLAAVHCAASGALVGSITQGIVGTAVGAVSGAVSHRLSTGSWTGAEQAAINGAATGFMTGTITGAISGAVSSPYCFVAGTTVLTAVGAAAIETIQAGDLVWAWDEETGDVALKPVVETYVNETDELVHVFAGGEEIVATPSHPFYSPVKGWTDAVHLRTGDILVLVNGEYVVVEKIQHEILEAPVTVYNFQVADYHTYFVTDNGILVHNTCATQRGLQRQKAAGMTNTSSITAPSGNARIPDYLNASTKVMGEAKSVKYLTKSKQLMDMFQYADANGYKMFLKIERWTRMSKPLQQAIQKYGVYVNIF